MTFSCNEDARTFPANPAHAPAGEHPVRPSEPRPPQRVFIDSSNWSCRSTQVAVSVLVRYLKAHRREMVLSPGEADLIILFTCSALQWLEERALDLHRFYRSGNPGAGIIITGCLTKVHPELFKTGCHVIPEPDDISRFLGTTDSPSDFGRYTDQDTFDLIQRSTARLQFESANPRLQTLAIKHLVPLLARSKNNEQLLEIMMSEGMYAASRRHIPSVEIAQGCIFQCSYCMIRKARGAVKSRPPEDILTDIEVLSRSSTEARIVAQDCGSYGSDTGSGFPELMGIIRNHFPGLKLHIHYLNPFWLQKDEQAYLSVFRDMDISAVDIPVQSCSQRMLKIMNRPYDIADVRRIIRRIRRVSPHTIIYSHCIVGHPGERVVDFCKSLALTGVFDFLAIFRYSPRKGTRSASMDDRVSTAAVRLRYLTLVNATRIRVLKRLFLNLLRDLFVPSRES